MKNIVLTNNEYIEVLKRARQNLDQIKKVWGEDSTEIGFKHTLSNVGLCDDELTTKETALFPEEFPKRRTMKYLGRHHKCPLDGRKYPGYLGWGMGCFSQCLIFQKNLKDIDEIKRLYDEQIESFQNRKFSEGEK